PLLRILPASGVQPYIAAWAAVLENISPHRGVPPGPAGQERPLSPHISAKVCCMRFGRHWTSLCFASSSGASQPPVWFVYLRPRACLQLPSDSTPRWTPLPLARGSYCQAHSGLAPPSCHSCRSHKKKLKNTRVLQLLSFRLAA
ncbi:MAG: hypothetical protein LBU32_07765, partial [Clostridiales bacterium]|nr:hypothetical protein [Clostridiales bacterium]